MFQLVKMIAAVMKMSNISVDYDSSSDDVDCNVSVEDDSSETCAALAPVGFLHWGFSHFF